MAKRLWHIITGDAKQSLLEIPSESVNCIITSPPYFRQREYGIDGQVGKEESLNEYTEAIVDIFRDAKRVLKKDGTFWLNIGDSYNGYKGSNRYEMTNYRKSIASGLQVMPAGAGMICKDLKLKDLIGVPWELAFALRKDGWYLRSDIIWSRPNANAESVVDRPTRAHEYLFLFSKSEKYYYNADAIRELCTDGKGTKNKRDVWHIPIQHIRGNKHPAPFPEKLVEPCILAGCPVDGIALDPFAGSGTVGVVALAYQRRFLGIEINPEFVELSKQRMFNSLGSNMAKDYKEVLALP